MDPFVAEIRIFPFNFAPKGWAFCDGQILPLSQNTALFSLLGTTYGGDGKSNFALPNLQGAAPLAWGQGPGLSDRQLGETGGAPTAALIASELAAHAHAVNATTSRGTSNDPAGNVWAEVSAVRQSTNLYGTAGGAAMAAGTLGASGGNEPHNNMPPYLTLNFCIALQGVYPPRS
jgi:microcystin-dependent protein